MSTLRERAEGPHRDFVLVGALVVVALVLRLLTLRQSLWGDELFLYDIVHLRTLPDSLSIVYRTESTPPGYFVAAWFSAHVAGQFGGDDTLWIRVPSLVLSVATVPLLYVLGRRTVGRPAGLVAAAIFAIATFDVFYGTEARTYAAVAFFSAAVALCVVELVRVGSRRWVVLTAVSVAAAAYCHYTIVFVLLVPPIWVAVYHRDRLKTVLLAYGGALVLYLPWYLGALNQFKDNTSERNPVVGDLVEYVRIVGRAAFGHPFVSLSDVPGKPALVLIVLGLLLGLLGLRKLRPSPPMVLILALALATPVCGAAYELTGNSFFNTRVMSSSLPAILLTIGALVTLPRRRVLAVVASALVVAGVAIGTINGLDRDHRRSPYLTVAQTLDRRAGPFDPVIEVAVTKDPPGHVLQYLFRRPHQYFPAGQPFNAAFRLGRRTGKLYVVAAKNTDSFVAFYRFEEHGFRLQRREELPGIVPLELMTYVPAS